MKNHACTYDRAGTMANGLPVRFGRLAVPVAEFVYEGRDARGTLHLWQEDGTWRAEPHAEPHPCDLQVSSAAGAKA